MSTVDLLDRILEQLGDVRARCPELRFGQLIAIVGELGQDASEHSLWDIEDTDFAAALERFAQDVARRESEQAEPAAAPDPGGMTSSSESTAPRRRGR